MSASQDRASEPGAVPAQGAPVRESIGSYLAAQRKLRGVSIEELSQQTRIPLRSLERLEAGSFDGEIDGFVRGFVRTVAEALGLDPDETLTRTLREPTGAGGRATPRLSVRRVVVSFTLLAVLVGVGFAVQIIAASLQASATPGPRSPIVIRRDPVRDLAEAQGVAALAPTPAVALASEARRAKAKPAPPGGKPAVDESLGTPARDSVPGPTPDAVARP